ncbi:MAG TPA: UDP-N-acetylmuramate--L-alanine ligase, partial [Firmicutes bacterium]|nr:UDP-N-acetylmuramate--L-alanine ligase [Bacillota bacterium]
NIPLWHRSDLLACFINNGIGIAVAGTHGKTTTTSMAALILEEGGLDPTAIVGGEVANFNSNARLGSGPYLVAEACESDHSFLRYYPEIAVITNIEADHLEFYDGSFDKLLDTYADFIKHVKPGGAVVYCADDGHVQKIMAAYKGRKIAYGINEFADYTAVALTSERGCFQFDLLEKGEALGRVVLHAPGKHNVANALAAAAVARLLGVGFEAISEALASFEGARRRFQVLGISRNIAVIDDYAHHPTEVKATLAAAREYSRGRVIAIFQPHRYTRLRFFMDEFAISFAAADKLLLLDVYPAGEEALPGITAAALQEKIQAGAEVPVDYCRTREQVLELLKKEAQEGDTVVFMGAGDISDTARVYYQEILGGREGTDAS